MQPTDIVHPPTIPAVTGSATRAGVVIQASAAILLGLFVVGMVGFSQADVLHNAAHDTRHSNAFPCH